MMKWGRVSSEWACEEMEKQTNKQAWHDRYFSFTSSSFAPSFSNLSHCQRAKNICAMVSATKINEIMAIITILCEKSLATIVSLSLLYNIFHASHTYICNNICTYKVFVTQLNSNSCRYFQLLFVPLFPFLVYWTAFKFLTKATSSTAADVIKFFILSCEHFFCFFHNQARSHSVW